jgi:hypothetical protein
MEGVIMGSRATSPIGNKKRRSRMEERGQKSIKKKGQKKKSKGK